METCCWKVVRVEVLKSEGVKVDRVRWRNYVDREKEKKKKIGRENEIPSIKSQANSRPPSPQKRSN